MTAWHNLLKRQLRRCFGEGFSVPPEWSDFVRVVDRAYRDADEDRGLLEHAMELSSRELMQQSRKLTILYEIISAANEREDLDALLPHVLNILLRFLRFDGGGVYLIDERKPEAYLVAWQSVPEAFAEKARVVPIDAFPFREVFREGRSAVGAAESILFPDIARAFSFQAMAAVPILARETIIGGLTFVSRAERSIPADEIAVLESIGREVGGAIRKVQMETSLRRHRESLQMLFDSVRELLLILDEEGTVMETNHAALVSLGFERQQLIGKSLLDLYPNSSRIEVQHLFEGMKTGDVRYSALPLCRQDGSRLYVEMTLTRGRMGTKEVLILSARDMTEHRVAEGMRRASEEKFRGLYESIKDGILLLDLRGNIQDANHVMLEMLGVTISEIVLLSVRDVASDRLREELDAIIAKIIREGDSGELERELKRNDGSFLPISLRAWLVRDEERRPVGIWALVRDVTERRQVEAEIQRRIAEIEKLNAFMVGREMRIIEMKREVNDLMQQLKRPPRYKV